MHAPRPKSDSDDLGYQQIADLLRQRILGGDWAPGHRLPTSRSLAEDFGTSQPTVHRAVAGLVEDGFIETRGRAGTYVASAPPHLSRFGIAFLSRPSRHDASWTLFHEALDGESQGAALPNGCRFVRYHGLIDHAPTNAAMQELISDVASKRLAGLILVGQINMLEQETLVIDPELPRVCLSESEDPRIPSIYYDVDQWVSRAASTLIERGRDRIAHIDFHAHEGLIHDRRSIDRLQRVAAEHGGMARPEWYLPASTQAPLAVSQMIQVLMSLPKDQRPNGLMVSDDNLLEYAVHGLMTAGVNVGPSGDMELVAHTNYPNRERSLLPVISLGSDVRWVLAKSIELLNQQREVLLEKRSLGIRVASPLMSKAEFQVSSNPLAALTHSHEASS